MMWGGTSDDRGVTYRRTAAGGVLAVRPGRARPHGGKYVYDEAARSGFSEGTGEAWNVIGLSGGARLFGLGFLAVSGQLEEGG